MSKTNIVLTGVGGQGVITAANILGKACVKAGVNVFVSEVHGMAQRGGSVNCTVRIGDVYGPLVQTGSADVILSTEPIEALRYIDFSNKDTKIITGINPVVPFTVSTGDEVYPDVDEVYKKLSSYGKVYKVDALKLAREAGAIITKNVVMLGALAGSGVLPFDKKILLDTVLENVPPKYKKINEKAFENGFNSIK